MSPFLLAAAAAFAAAGAAAPAAETATRASAPYWTKVYSTAPYREHWTGELEVQDLDKDLPKVLAAIEKENGRLAEPLANLASSRSDKSQQLAFSLPLRSGKPLLKRLRRLGAIADPAVRSEGAPIPLAEVRAKIAALTKEKGERAVALAQVPAAAAAADEILAHLLTVEAVASRADPEARFSLLVRGR